ncbi:MAG TPA: hypothetical protein VGR29_03145 [Thermomicrobiales bacterium]|nr:hypothetical protein [Thermomicrobiales bacterium]
MTRWESIETFGGWFPGSTVVMTIPNRTGNGPTIGRQRASSGI